MHCSAMYCCVTVYRFEPRTVCNAVPFYNVPLGNVAHYLEAYRTILKSTVLLLYRFVMCRTVMYQHRK